MLCVFQEGEQGKEEEEKENFGKLEYTLDYNFTDNQVHTPAHSMLQAYRPLSNLPNIERINEPNNRRTQQNKCPLFWKLAPFQNLGHKNAYGLTFLPPSPADSWHPPGSRPSSNGLRRDLRSLCQSLHAARQEEEV